MLYLTFVKRFITQSLKKRNASFHEVKSLKASQKSSG